MVLQLYCSSSFSHSILTYIPIQRGSCLCLTFVRHIVLTSFQTSRPTSNLFFFLRYQILIVNALDLKLMRFRKPAVILQKYPFICYSILTGNLPLWFYLLLFDSYEREAFALFEFRDVFSCPTGKYISSFPYRQGQTIWRSERVRKFDDDDDDAMIIREITERGAGDLWEWRQGHSEDNAERWGGCEVTTRRQDNPSPAGQTSTLSMTLPYPNHWVNYYMIN